MLAKIHRFQGPNSLKFVYQKGTTVRGPLFSIKSAFNSRRGNYRVAVVVSRKVHKSAVVRNRLRRQVYETIRNLEGGITQPYDIVVTVFSESLLDEPSGSLKKQLKKQLAAAGVLTDQNAK